MNEETKRIVEAIAKEIADISSVQKRLIAVACWHNILKENITTYKMTHGEFVKLCSYTL